MRLTKRQSDKVVSVKDQIACISKLCQLEDIEDELGIDLITLFKAFKNGIWIKYDDEIVFHKAPYKTLVENIGYFRRLFEKEYAQNYGKTWTLTKEELI